MEKAVGFLGLCILLSAIILSITMFLRPFDRYYIDMENNKAMYDKASGKFYYYDTEKDKYTVRREP